MKIKLGLHMCGWGDRPVPDVLVAARELGYDGVELAPAWLEKTYDGLQEIGRFLAQEGAPLAPAVSVGGPELSIKRIVWLMFNRWIQESDFLYLRRHFGIGEMTERGHDAYADIAFELTDRQVESLDHKQATKERGKKRGELAGALVEQRSQGPVGDLDELRREPEALGTRLAKHHEELQLLRAAEPDREVRGPLDRLGRKIGDIAASIVGNREAREGPSRTTRPRNGSANWNGGSSGFRPGSRRSPGTNPASRP